MDFLVFVDFFWQNGNTGLTSVQSHHGSASVEYEFQKYNLLLIVYYNIIPKHLQPNFLILLAELYFKTAIGVWNIICMELALT